MIQEPREGRPRLQVTAVHQEHSRGVVGNVCEHGPDHANVVDVFSHLGKEFADFNPALPVLFETERRSHEIAGLAFGLDVFPRHRLAVMFRQQRLGIEGVNGRKTAIHEKKDDALDFGGEMSRLYGQRLGRVSQRSGAQPGISQQTGVAIGSEAASNHPEQIAAAHAGFSGLQG